MYHYMNASNDRFEKKQANEWVYKNQINNRFRINDFDGWYNENHRAVYITADMNSSNDNPFEIQVMAENLFVPWALDISEEGRIYFTERSGNVRVIEDGQLLFEPLITIPAPFISQSEGGLLGIVLDPDFRFNHYIYVMYTYEEDGQIFNRVVRLVEQDNRAYEDMVLIDKIPGGQVHNGGRLKIGPDRKLYITTGDGGNSSSAQDINSMAGKILRIELDGRIPEDNPIKDSPVYSLGLRNPQGLTWNNNQVYETDHGPTGQDEINRIIPGGNYGWPLEQGDGDGRESEFIKPILLSGRDTWAPSGIAYINQGPLMGHLLAAALRGEKLLIITLNDTGTEVVRTEALLPGEYGRLREVFQAKDGSIFITTSNMDGRGNPRIGDDKILRMVPSVPTS